MNHSIVINDISELQKAAREFLNITKNERKFAFYAPMGAGKTTFISAVLKELKLDDKVSSPTYSIVNEYFSLSFGIIYHFDFYRLNGEEEAFDIGAEELLESDHYCFIEWPEKIPNLLPLNCVNVTITVEDDRRHIKVSK